MKRPAIRRRRRTGPRFRVLMILLAGLTIGFFVSRQGSPPSPRPTPLRIGERVGQEVFPEGDTASGGIGQNVGKFSCQKLPSLGGAAVAHLTLIAFGRTVSIPPAIGVVPPRQKIGAIVSSGACAYPVHTVDDSGLLEMEKLRGLTLGLLFAVWGEKLSRTDVAGYRGRVEAYVNGAAYHGPLDSIRLVDGEQVTLEVGPEPRTPPVYSFRSGR